MPWYPSNARYERENILRVTTKLNRKTEPELVERVEREDNKAGYIKKLIKQDVDRERGGERTAE